MYEDAPAPVRLEPPQQSDAQEILQLFAASRLAALGFLTEPETTSGVASWITEVIIPRPGTWVARDSHAILGFLSLQGSYLDQLYVHPSHFGQGLGTRLLDHAKSLSPAGLHLHTFQCNVRARRFYEARGFLCDQRGDGSANQERQPDMSYRWTPASESMRS